MTQWEIIKQSNKANIIIHTISF